MNKQPTQKELLSKPAGARRLHRLLLWGTMLLLMLVTFASYLPNSTTPIEQIDANTRDWAMRLRGRQEPSGEIVIIAIDDFSLNWVGVQWPWPRSYFAEIVNWLNQAGARVIGIDVVLFDPDHDPAGDQALAEALRNAQGSVSVMQYYTSTEILSDHVLRSETIKKPLESIYADAFTTVGTTAILLDEDAVARSLQAYQITNNKQETFYNWALQLAHVYVGGGPPYNPTPNGLYVNSRWVPLNHDKLMINYTGPAGNFPTYSAAEVFEGDHAPELFKDKIVLIGATSLTLQDVYATPFSATTRTPGVEVVANALDTILNENYIRIAPPWAGLISILLAALLASLITRFSRPGLTIASMMILLLAYAVVYYLVFLNNGLYLPFIGPEAMLFLGVVLPTLEQAVSQEVEKRRVHNLFSRFISPEMVDQLVSTQDINSLNKRADLSILFSDIRGFTTLSEKLSPEEVVGLLNPYLEVMTEVIYKHGGTVDKYEGDAILAFFGEPVAYPDHAQRAVNAAIDMRYVLTDLKKRWEKEGRLPEHFDIGIGINSGEVFVGLLGSAQRVNYTIIGDNVNLTARLQDLTKKYAWPVLITEGTYQQVKEKFDAEFIESVVMRGKSEAVKIYKVLGRKDASPSERLNTMWTWPR
ncbi:MAG: adenylate/guanylate cyclase domain-containing protein [Anaerolineales bacterium]|nr:adenylate/guanylate cyclase domain-containing protein [Anaerolineales bacterium]